MTLAVGKVYVNAGGDKVAPVVILDNPLQQYCSVVCVRTLAGSGFQTAITYGIDGEWNDGNHDGDMKIIKEFGGND